MSKLNKRESYRKNDIRFSGYYSKIELDSIFRRQTKMYEVWKVKHSQLLSDGEKLYLKVTHALEKIEIMRMKEKWKWKSISSFFIFSFSLFLFSFFSFAFLLPFSFSYRTALLCKMTQRASKKMQRYWKWKERKKSKATTKWNESERPNLQMKKTNR